MKNSYKNSAGGPFTFPRCPPDFILAKVPRPCQGGIPSSFSLLLGAYGSLGKGFQTSGGMPPPQVGDTPEAGRDQEQIRTDPRRRGAEAGGREADGGDKEPAHHRPCDHLQHPRQDGQGAEAHARG